MLRALSTITLFEIPDLQGFEIPFCPRKIFIKIGRILKSSSLIPILPWCGICRIEETKMNPKKKEPLICVLAMEGCYEHKCGVPTCREGDRWGRAGVIAAERDRVKKDRTWLSLGEKRRDACSWKNGRVHKRNWWGKNINYTEPN